VGRVNTKSKTLNLANVNIEADGNIFSMSDLEAFLFYSDYFKPPYLSYTLIDDFRSP